ncbi:hypothetical protein SO802_010400 [Lithocarpus litseifolius]|uniref:Reverse transcriptase n=1 Tax=Lithocarpus litseifolius TaxID=425828 RepID=A0AAW2DE46_9ROSI
MGNMIGAFEKIDWEDRLPRNIRFMWVKIGSMMIVLNGYVGMQANSLIKSLLSRVDRDRLSQTVSLDTGLEAIITSGFAGPGPSPSSPTSVRSDPVHLPCLQCDEGLGGSCGPSRKRIGTELKRLERNIRQKLIREFFSKEVVSNGILQLCELAAFGQRFTWINNREEVDFVMERLDRAFASVDWVNMYPLYSLRNHPIVRSNHGPIILDLELQTPFRKRPFRFEHMWITHSSCKCMVQQAWDLQSNQSRTIQLRKKLTIVKKMNVEWNKKVFGKVENEIKLKQNQLQQLHDSIVNVEYVRKERAFRKELKDLLDREELIWAQKARTNWFLHGDKNTKYFQTVVRKRRARSRILKIKDEQGILTDKTEDIENILLNFFRKSYDGKNNVSVDSIVQ